MLVRLTLIVAIAGMLGGCGHSDLKAPCDASESVLSYAEVPPVSNCGPMRALNGPAPFDRMNRDAEPKGRRAQ